MVLVLGVSVGASGARAILAHSDQPDLPPIDFCLAHRQAGAALEEAALAAIARMQAAADTRGEVITATAVACRTEAAAEAIRAAAPRLDRCGRLQVVNEATAQLRYLRFVGRLPDEGSVVLYDLGSSGLTLSLADCTGNGTVERTNRSTVLCGDGFDTLLQWRLARLGIVIDCDAARRHREALSTDSVVTAEDRKSGQRLVFTNSDFTDLANAGLQHSVTAIRQLADDDELDCVVLLGGCSRNRALAEQLAIMLELPVYAEPEPELVSARGAALMAADRPTRAVRIGQAIRRSADSARPIPDRPSRTKLIAALAVTGTLSATIIGLIASDWKTTPRGANTSPMEIATIPPQPFK